MIGGVDVCKILLSFGDFSFDAVEFVEFSLSIFGIFNRGTLLFEELEFGNCILLTQLNQASFLLLLNCQNLRVLFVSSLRCLKSGHFLINDIQTTLTLGVIIGRAALIECHFRRQIMRFKVGIFFRRERLLRQFRRQPLNVEFVISGAFLQAVIIGGSSRRVEDNQYVAFLNELPFLNGNFLDDTFVFDLDGFNLPRRNDFAARNRNFIYLAQK